MEGKTFIFFGIFGSGKGTQSKLLMDYVSKKGKEVLYMGTGDGLRRLASSESYSSSLIRSYMDQGKLIPDFLVTSIITENLLQSFSKEKNLFFDGFPRTKEQSETLDQIFNFFEIKDINLIYIKINRDEAVTRNKIRGREDDTEEVFMQRYEEHVNKEIPALNYFKEKEMCTLHEINGEQPIDKVHEDIIKALNI